MKKNILIAGCVISCFILVSLSYQPIIAEKPIKKQMKNDNLPPNKICEWLDKKISFWWRMIENWFPYFPPSFIILIISCFIHSFYLSFWILLRCAFLPELSHNRIQSDCGCY